MLILLFVFVCLCWKRMYLQHYALRSICFPLEILYIFALSSFICKVFFSHARLKSEARFTVFLRNKEVWNNVCMEMNLGKRTLLYVVILFFKESEYLDLEFFCEPVCPQGLHFYKKIKTNGCWLTDSFVVFQYYRKLSTYRRVTN